VFALFISLPAPDVAAKAGLFHSSFPGLAPRGKEKKKWEERAQALSSFSKRLF